MGFASLDQEVEGSVEAFARSSLFLNIAGPADDRCGMVWGRTTMSLRMRRGPTGRSRNPSKRTGAVRFEVGYPWPPIRLTIPLLDFDGHRRSAEREQQ